MTPFFLIEVIRLADGSFGGQPLKFRVVATCATKGECDQQAERRARANPESGFDPIQDAWWGKSGELVCCYHQAMTRPRGLGRCSTKVSVPPAGMSRRGGEQ